MPAERSTTNTLRVAPPATTKARVQRRSMVLALALAIPSAASLIVAVAFGPAHIFLGDVGRALARMLLFGVAVGGLNVSFTTFILSVSPSGYDVGRQVVHWILGGLDGRTWDHVLLACGWMAILLRRSIAARSRCGRHC